MRLLHFPLLLATGCLQPHPGTEDESETTVEPGSTGDSSETTAEPGSCGDGMSDSGEACDDGNDGGNVCIAFGYNRAAMHPDRNICG